MEDITPDQLRAIDERMRELVAQDIPIIRQRLLSTEAVQLYTKLGMEDKVALLETRPHLYVTLYTMADLSGYFYGALAPTTGYVPLFGLHKYYKGIHLSVPCRTNPSRLENMVPQHKMFDVFSEYTRWVDVLGVATIGVLNTRILEGGGGDLIKIAEAFHEKEAGQHRRPDRCGARNRRRPDRADFRPVVERQNHVRQTARDSAADTGAASGTGVVGRLFRRPGAYAAG